VSNAIVSIGGTEEPASLHESVPARGPNRRLGLVLAGTVALFASLASSGQARANGALPASLGIMLPADKPQDVVLATNFGIILSDDGGASWLWTCERPETSFGYLYSVSGPPRSRFYALANTMGPGSLDDGWLSYSDDASCTWHRVGGTLQNEIVTDYFVDRSNPDHVLVVASAINPGGDPGPPAVYQSTDAGVTFSATPLYTAPAGANVVSVEIARSNPMIIYLAMLTTADRHPHLVRSSDGGQTWMERDVQASVGSNEARILTVDPNDPDLVYLRVIALGMESVMVTRDAGMTFATPVTVSGGTLSAFARLASGTVLVAGLVNLTGGGMNGVAYRSTDGGKTFGPWTLDPQPHILGLAERDGVLYVAGKNYSDGWALATSHDEGVTLTPLSSYDNVRGIAPCVTTVCASACALYASQAVWTNDVCTGALLDAGTQQDGGTKPPPGPSGCHCAAGGGAGSASIALALLGVALVLRRRRRDR
jgi:MYXO-CTERM domain-containing protein